jgi:hypothetical protein
MPRIDQHHLQLRALQLLIQRDPIDPGGLHGHRLDLARLQPLDQSIPTPAVSEWLKTTPTGRPDARASGGEGRESETEQLSQRETAKTSEMEPQETGTVNG